MLCVKGVHQSRESRRLDSIWTKWVPNTFSFRNLASEFSVFGQVNLGFIFIQNAMYLWYLVTRTQSRVILNLSRLYFLFNQWEWNNSVMYFVFSIFFLNFYFCKKISDDSITLAQKEKFPKSIQISFLRAPLILAVSHTVVLSYPT